MTRACLLSLLLVCAAAAPAAADGAPALLGYDLKGTLVDPEPDLRAVLDTVLVKGKPWDERMQAGAIEILDRLHYRHEEPRLAVRAGGVHVTFDIHPQTLVRHIRISGNAPMFSGIFQEEVLPRMRLRPGSAVPDDEKERAQTFDDEARRLEDWLAKQGYFDARVAIYAEPDGPHALKLFVKIVKGPAYSVGKVTVEGNTSIPDDEIVAIMQQTTLLGLRDDRFSKEELNADLGRVRDLYHRNGFPGVRVTTTYDPATSPDRGSRTVNFTVIVREKKKIDVAFEGNSALGHEALQKVITFDGEGSYDDFEVERSAAAIRRLYQSKGYFQAVVTAQRVRLLPTFERILFKIDEGPRLYVRRISFLGNHSVTDAELIGVVRTKPFPGFFGLLSSGGFVTSVQLEQDRQAIEDLYRRRGYHDVRVRAQVANRPDLLEDVGAMAAATTAEQLGESLYIRFVIEEGGQELVDRIQYNGNREVSDRELEAATSLRRGSPFTVGAMESDRDRIRRFYQNRAFPYTTIDTTAKPGRKPGTVDVVHTIREGEAVRVGRVFARGNFKTKSWVIREVLGLDEGDLLTLGRWKRGQEALRATGLFSSVRLDLVGLEAQGNPVHPIVEIQERYDHRAQLELGAGMSTDNLVFAALGVANRNVGGIGVNASISGEYGYDIRYGRADLKFPYWVLRRGLAVPLDLAFYGFGRQEDTERYGTLLQYGGGAELSRQYPSGWFMSGRYSIVQKSIDEELIRGAGPDEELETTPVTIRTASVGGIVILDRRTDRRGNPVVIGATKGYRLSLSGALAATFFGGTDTFAKVGTTAQFLTPLGKRIIITNGVRYDHGVPLGDSVILPETERYMAGGDTTVRGVEEDRLHTEVIRSELPPLGLEQVKVIPAGGNIRFIHNLDVQFQLWRIGGMPLASALFLDTGVVMNSFADFQPAKLRHSVGIAFLRFLTPIITASLEYAIPIDPQTGDDPTGRFHFNLGFVGQF